MNAIRPLYQKNSSQVLKLYSLMSFVAAGIFFIQDFSQSWFLRPDAFLISLFFVGHLGFYFSSSEVSSESEVRLISPALFLFQTVMLPFLAYQQQESLYLFFAVIPCGASTLFELNRNQRYWRWSMMARTTYLSGIFCLLFFVLEFSRFSLFQGDLSKAAKVLYFMFWTQAFLGLAFSYEKSKNKKTTSNSEFRTGSEQQDLSISNDQLFYHDMINVTHGLLLFLKQRCHQDRGLDSTELAMVINEVESVQSYLKDHFKFTHKDLKRVKNLVSFSEAQSGLYSMVHTFLTEQGVQTQMLFQGYLEEGGEKRAEVLVHYPTLHRIFTNLIKNVHDHKAQLVEIIFFADDSHLTLTVKNPVKKQIDKAMALEKTLGQLIMATDFEKSKDTHGVGLESVQELAQSQGGEFHCHIEDGIWVSKVILTHPLEAVLTENKSLKRVA